MVDLAGRPPEGSQDPTPADPEPGPQRLSQTRLWADMRAYYSTAGVDAWTSTVPYHITSNNVIADCYAQIIVRFIGDVVATGRFDPDVPFYIVELGAGSGKFGFHLLRRVTQLRRDLGLANVSVVHVMADIAATNIEFWRTSPRLSPFVDAGILTFSHLDIEVDRELRLAPDGDLEAPPVVANLANPLIVVANYLFDSLSQDFFNVTDGRLDEMLAEVEDAPGPSSDATDAPSGMRKVVWSAKPTALPYYHDTDLDAVLAERAACSPDQAVLFPVAGLRFLKHLLLGTGGRLCLVASDLGLSERGLAKAMKLETTIGYFYLPVDLDAMGDLLLRFGPGIHVKATSNLIDTSVSIVGFEAEELGQTRHAFRQSIETFGPCGYKTVAALLSRAGADMTIEQWLSIAALLQYDSIFLDASVDIAAKWIQSGPLLARTRSQVMRALEHFGSGCYWLPGASDTYFNMGMILRSLGEVEAAIRAFTMSIDIVGDAAETRFNLGLCFNTLGRRAEALASLERAVQLDPVHIRARGWAARISSMAEVPDA